MTIHCICRSHVTTHYMKKPPPIHIVNVFPSILAVLMERAVCTFHFHTHEGMRFGILGNVRYPGHQQHGIPSGRRMAPPVRMNCSSSALLCAYLFLTCVIVPRRQLQLQMYGRFGNCFCVGCNRTTPAHRQQLSHHVGQG